jgi:TatD DNase family protein
VIDFHCHLDLYPNPSAVARECAILGMTVLSVTTTPSAWPGTNALAEWPKCFTAVGLHPQLASERKSELSLFDSLLERTPFVGEVGLDGSPEFREIWNDQVAVLEYVLASCARAGGKVLSVHSRRAIKPVLNLLRKNPDAGRTILHWFSGSAAELIEAIDLGCWFSVGPAMVRTANGRDLLRQIPAQILLPESDGPFVRDGKRPVMPWQVDSVYAAVAELKSVPLDELHIRLDENVRRLVVQ